MKTHRVRLISAAVVGALLAFAPPVRAQTETPTPTVEPTGTATLMCTPPSTPLPCAGAKKLRLGWSSRNPLNPKVFVSATHCQTPATCATADDSGAVTLAPVTVTVRDASGKTMSGTLTTPPINHGGCPGGIDSYFDSPGRVRLIFGSDGATTVLGRLVVQQPDPTPPALTPPLSFSVRDSCGYFVEGVVTTCFTRQTSTRTDLKCF